MSGSAAGPGAGLREKLLLLGSLYTTQYLALGFFIVALPTILRERGMPLEQISLFYLLGLLWVFKFLWAPFIERFGSRRLGHYRGWLLVLQSLLIVSVLCMIPLSLDTDFALLMVRGRRSRSRRAGIPAPSNATPLPLTRSPRRFQTTF